MRQFGRAVEVVVAPARGGQGRSWSQLRIGAEVKKTDSKKPDEATVRIWNLAPDSRGFLQGRDMALVLKAGYGPQPPIVFQGEVDEVEVKFEGTDIITEVKARDGGVAYASASSESYNEPHLDTRRLVERIAAGMGLKVATFPDLPVETFPRGVTAMGTARMALDEALGTIGATWSIQRGTLVVTQAGKPIAARAVVLSPDTGLVGSPEPMKKKGKPTGGFKVRALLGSDFAPHRQVQLDSRAVRGLFRVKTASLTLDSGYSQEFYADLELEPF